MGRTLATFRELIEQELRGWERVFGRALRREERAHLEAMFNRVRLYTQACTYEFPVHAMDRSEEHTSELQSRLHLVCRLLLEKKKKKYITPPVRAKRISI